MYKWLNGVTFSGSSSSWSSWAQNQAYAVNDTVYDGTFGLQRVVTAGTSGSSAPTWAKGMYYQTTDGSVTWELMGTPKCYDTSTFSSGTIQNAPWVCPINETGGNTGWLVWYTPLDSSFSYTVPTGMTCEYTLQEPVILSPAAILSRYITSLSCLTQPLAPKAVLFLSARCRKAGSVGAFRFSDPMVYALTARFGEDRSGERVTSRERCRSRVEQNFLQAMASGLIG